MEEKASDLTSEESRKFIQLYEMFGAMDIIAAGVGRGSHVKVGEKTIELILWDEGEPYEDERGLRIFYQGSRADYDEFLRLQKEPGYSTLYSKLQRMTELNSRGYS